MVKNYQNSKVFKITNKNNDKYYLGITTVALSQLLATYKYQYKHKKPRQTVFQLFENNDAKIELVATIPCNNIDEQYMKARNYFEEHKHNLINDDYLDLINFQLNLPSN